MINNLDQLKSCFFIKSSQILTLDDLSFGPGQPLLSHSAHPMRRLQVFRRHGLEHEPIFEVGANEGALTSVRGAYVTLKVRLARIFFTAMDTFVGRLEHKVRVMDV